MNLHTPLSLAAAQKALGFESEDTEGRALLRELEAREKTLGVTIVIRHRGPRRTVRRVTLAAIRQHAPDLFPGNEERLVREFRAYLRDIDKRIEDRVAEAVTKRAR